MTVVMVDAALCTGCGTCVGACPHAAISLSGGVAVVDQRRCRTCGLCLSACPTGAIVQSDSALVPVAIATPPVVVARPAQALDEPTVAKQAIWPTLAIATGTVARELLPVLVEWLVPVISRAVSRSSRSGLTRAVVDGGMRFRRRRRGPWQ